VFFVRLAVLIGAVFAGLHYLWEWVSMWDPLTVASLVGGAGGLVAGRRWWIRRCRARFASNARMVTVLVPPGVDPAGGVVLWSNLVGLLRPAWRRWFFGQPHVVWEYAFSDTGVAIGLWVPGIVPPGLIERAVEAAWPGAHTHTSPAGPPLPLTGPGRRRLMTGGVLRLAQREALPVNVDFDADPARTLIGSAAGLRSGEHACVQILARPVTGHRVWKAHRAARRWRSRRLVRIAGWLLRVLIFGLRGARRRRRPLEDPLVVLERSARDRAITTKQRGGHYETVIRYAVAVDLPDTAVRRESRAARDVVRGKAHALAATYAGFTEFNYYTRRRLFRADTVLARRRLGKGDLLSVPELAALAHLPADEDIPGVQRAGARAVAPPPGIAGPGPDCKPLGTADTGSRRLVALRVPDARHHLHLIGATGSGKSTLLGNMILADAEAGRGIVLIDPKGDLVTDLLSRLPASAAERIVLFDADSRTRPPCLNPLDGGETHLTVDNLVSVFSRVYAAYWGPRTDDVMRAACLTLRAHPGVASLADLPKLLTEPAFRSRLTTSVTDPVLRGFWAWYAELSDAARSQVISPLLNKLRAFLLRPFVRDAITAGKSTVDMNEVLDHGGICLVRIPKGSLGEETTRLVGSFVVARTWQAATGRARVPEHQRRDASLVIDECHNFLNLPYPIEDMLAEARGFRLAMTLAHQHLAQLPRELKEALSTNARSKIFFNASPEDARELARHTTPRLTEHDLAHLGRYHAAARLVLHSADTEPFTILTTPLPPAIPGRAHHIRRTIHAHTTRPITPTSPTRPTARDRGGRPVIRPHIADPRRH
jgi:hypothetical protein